MFFPAAPYLCPMSKPPSLKPPRQKPKPAQLMGGAPQGTALLELVGSKIRKARLKKGVSQEGLAYSIPIDRAHMGRIENGKAAPNVTTLFKIALALDCEVTAFIPKLAQIREVLLAEEQAAGSDKA